MDYLTIDEKYDGRIDGPNDGADDGLCIVINDDGFDDWFKVGIFVGVENWYLPGPGEIKYDVIYNGLKIGIEDRVEDGICYVKGEVPNDVTEYIFVLMRDSMLGYMLISMMNLIFFWKKEHMIDYKVYLRLDLF